MHIAIFDYGLKIGGAPRRLIPLARGLAQKGHNVDLVVVNPRGPLLRELPKEIRLVPLSFGLFAPFVYLLSKRFQIFLSRLPLALYLRQAKPNVLLSGANIVHLSAIAARCLSRAKIPLVLRISNHLTAPLFWKKSWQKLRYRYRVYRAQRLYPKAEAIIAVSEGLAKDVVHATGIDPSRVTVVYSPFDISELQEKTKEPVAHPWFKERKFPIILGVGRLSPQKDFATLIRAFFLVRQKYPSRLIILGDGKERSKLEALIKELNLSADVSLPGFVLNPLPFMACADVFVLSSRWEGLPGVLIEALAVGCPVVSTDCPSGPREILEDGKYGPLVPIGDHQALAEAILETFKNPLPRQFLIRRAKDFSLEKAVNGYLKAFRKVICVDYGCFLNKKS